MSLIERLQRLDERLGLKGSDKGREQQEGRGGLDTAPRSAPWSLTRFRLAVILGLCAVLVACTSELPAITAGDGSELIGNAAEDRTEHEWVAKAVLGTLRDDGLTYGEFINDRLEAACPDFSPGYARYQAARSSDTTRALVLFISGYQAEPGGCLNEMDQYWQTLATVDLLQGKVSGVADGEFVPSAGEPGAGWFADFTAGRNP